MRSAWTTEENRWAMVMVVRPRASRFSASRMALSFTPSRLEVASSRIRMGASFSSARAMAMRWRSPPESFDPRSPTTVRYPWGSAVMNP